MSSHSASDGHAHSTQAHHSHAQFYTMIFGILVVLTIVTVVASRIDFGIMNLVIAMGIASVKAGLVALFFMHLKYENPLTWLYAAFPLVLLALLIGLLYLDEPLRVVPTGARDNGKPSVYVKPGAPLEEGHAATAPAEGHAAH